MNIVNFGTEVRTMTSREIAELTGKEHKNVLADIRKMLEDLDLSSAGFSAQYKDSTGRTLPCFNLPKRETLILVSGYSIPMRAKIIDRWEALEAKVGAGWAAIPQTLPEALRLAADLAEQKAKLRTALLAYTEKVMVLEANCVYGC